jgi:exodeoxyribonuclease VII large subunit
MQGEETEAGVLKGLEVLSSYPDVSAIVIARGGGSRSDLIWFEKKAIAYAIAQCRKPVITGIGHEIDLSVADLVAHESRKTPTAAAQFLVEKLSGFDRSLREAALRVRSEALAQLGDRHRELKESVRAWRQSAALVIQRHRGELADGRRRAVLDARRHLAVARKDLAGLPARLGRGALDKLRGEADKLKAARKECELKDPRRLLERGYSLVSLGGKIVKSVGDLRPGSSVETQLRDGVFSSEVRDVRRKR